jgi:hypothetical protein
VHGSKVPAKGERPIQMLFEQLAEKVGGQAGGGLWAAALPIHVAPQMTPSNRLRIVLI